ncbi:MAG: pilus assembly protein [Actinomycetia bacterium]|nr:pilus assembly protein [Actinomycetes bacterium]
MKDRGQATVELALALPLLCLMLLGVVQVAVIGRGQLAVQLAAHEAARAAAVSADPETAATTAANHAVSLRPLDVQVASDDTTITVTVSYVDHTDVSIVGALLSDVTLQASATMAFEPP